ncbi:MAG: peptidylprolyl isomerase, partial [Thermodesulfobacteriota bacterium]|nr:peptidylprolyl isomerase [Thermodesulfobacteriota bacterium]
VAVPAEEKKASDNRVAEVNGSVITKAEFDSEMSRVKGRLLAAGQTPSNSQTEEIKKEVLESLIDRELLLQESAKKKITVDDSSVAEQIGSLKKRFPDDAKYKDWLVKMGFSEDELKSRLKGEMAIKQLIDREIVEKIAVSEKEAKEYYNNNPDSFRQAERVHASHILITFDKDADASAKEAARKKLGEIEERLKKGEDFSALAKEFSECPSSEKGGDLGYFGRGQMVKPFEDAAFALEPGTVSEIVETQFGYHLIKSIDKKPATTIPYSNISERLKQYLKNEKVKKETPIYLSNLKAKATVKWHMK